MFLFQVHFHSLLIALYCSSNLSPFCGNQCVTMFFIGFYDSCQVHNNIKNLQHSEILQLFRNQKLKSPKMENSCLAFSFSTFSRIFLVSLQESTYTLITMYRFQVQVIDCSKGQDHRLGTSCKVNTYSSQGLQKSSHFPFSCLGRKLQALEIGGNILSVWLCMPIYVQSNGNTALLDSTTTDTIMSISHGEMDYYPHSVLGSNVQNEMSWTLASRYHVQKWTIIIPNVISNWP